MLTNWVDKNDGILVVDKNNDGNITDASEMLGDGMSLSGGGIATDGYNALADYDSNNDGVIDSNDAHFSDIKILKGDWTLMSLSEAGIVSLSLNNTTTSTVDSNGNTQVALGSYTK